MQVVNVICADGKTLEMIVNFMKYHAAFPMKVKDEQNNIRIGSELTFLMLM